MSRIVGVIGEANPVAAWRSRTPAYFPFITQRKYEAIWPSARRWYDPYRCPRCATHTPEKTNAE